jgi:hypothetical protein
MRTDKSTSQPHTALCSCYHNKDTGGLVTGSSVVAKSDLHDNLLQQVSASVRTWADSSVRVDIVIVLPSDRSKVLSIKNSLSSILHQTGGSADHSVLSPRQYDAMFARTSRLLLTRSARLFRIPLLGTLYATAGYSVCCMLRDEPSNRARLLVTYLYRSSEYG